MPAKGFPAFSRQGRFGLFLLALYALWIAAWLLRTGPVERYGGTYFADPNHDTLYWVFLKVLVWTVPLTFYLRQLYGVGLWEYLGLSRWTRRGWAWGLAASGLLAGLCLAYDLLTGKAFFHPARFIPGPFLNIVLVSPLLEEIFFRGFFLRQLEERWKNFRVSNLAASLTWVLVHWIGWHFQGRISFPGTLEVSLQLGVLGFLWGYLNHWSRSLWTSLLLHMSYNLYSTNFWNYFAPTGPHA